MVAIFAGAGFGLERGSGSVLGGAGLVGPAAQGASGEGVFVNAASGNLVLQKQDEFLAGLGVDVGVSRTYNSLTTLGDDNNDRWRQSTDRRVYGLTGAPGSFGSTVKRVSSDGTEITYSWSGAAYVARDGAGAYDTIVQSGSQWVWTDGDSGMVERYSTSGTGQIQSVTDRNGNQLTFSYDASGRLSQVTDANGEWVRYERSGTSNNIADILTGYTDLATSTARTLTRTRYGYDGSNRLTSVATDLTPGDNSVSDGASYATTYGYDSSGRVNSITQSDGSSLAITYDGSGRVQTLVQTVSSGVTRTTTLGYSTGYTTVTDPSGQVTRLDYDASGNLTRITAPPAWSGAAQQVVQFTYNANGDVTSVTDALGNATAYSNFTSNGLAQTVTDRLGNAVTRTFSSTNLLLSETRTGVDATGAAVSETTRYVYNAAGNLRFVISPQGRVTEYTLTSAGLVREETEYAQASYTTSGTPNESTMASWVSGLADRSWVQKSANTYDARGNLTATTRYGLANSSGVGQTSDGYDVTTWTYDQAGQLLSSYAGSNTATTYAYDGMGRVISTSDANGGTTTIAFNAGSNTTTITLASGYVTTKTYNKAGELISLTDSGSNTTGSTTSYTYDALGRVRVTTDATGLRHYTLYDGAGRHVGNVDNDGNLTEYVYDADNRLIGTLNYHTKLGSATLTNLANPAYSVVMSTLRPVTSSQDTKSWVVYDKEGQVLQTIAGDGSTTISTYDASGRLQQTTAYVNKLAQATVDGFITTPPTTVSTPTASSGDTVARQFHDLDGLLIGSLDGEGYLAANTYDQAGRLTATTRYATATTASLRATGSFNALLASVASSVFDRTTRFTYDGRGLLRYSVDALNEVTRFDYDTAGQKTTTTVYAATISTSDYSYAGVKTAMASLEANSANRRSFAVYDAAGRLAYGIDPAGTVTGYSYDNRGQVTRVVEYAASYATTTLPALATMSGWSASNIANSANRITRTWYSARGEVAFVVDAEGYATRRDYDAKGQLKVLNTWTSPLTVGDSTTFAQVAAAVSGTPVTSKWDYDSLGRVVTAWDGNNVTTTWTYHGATSLVNTVTRAANASSIEQSTKSTLYDGAGRTIQVTDALGTSDTTSYNGRGLVTATTAAAGLSVAQTTSYTYDLDGRVRTITNAMGGVTAYEYNAFGEAWKTTDPGGNVTYNWYDKLGRVTTTRDAGNYTTTTAYTTFGEVASVTRWQQPVFDYTPMIYRMYDIALGRAPLQWEVDDWAWRMANLYGSIVQPAAEGWASDDWGTRTNRLEAAFADILGDSGVQAHLGGPSTSDATFINNLYNAAFHRAATADEITVWSANIANGWTRAGLCTFFSEYYWHRMPLVGTGQGAIDYSSVGGQIYRMYEVLLGRTATAPEVANWTWRMDNLYGSYVRPSGEPALTDEPAGLSWNRLEGAYADILNDPGIAARMGADNTSFVTNLYNYAFKRHPTSYEVEYWVGQLNSGTWSRAGMAMLLAELADHRAFLSIVGPTIAPPLTTGIAAVTSFSYDKAGRVLTSTDALRNVESYAYDAFGNRTQLTNKLGGITKYSYDRLGQLTREQVTAATTNWPAGSGTTVAADYQVTTWSYDARGNRLQKIEGYSTTDGGAVTSLRTTTYSYDANNRLVQEAGDYVPLTGAGGKQTFDIRPTQSYVYDARGNLISRSDANGSLTLCWYDRLDRKTAELDAAGTLTSYGYDANGNLISTRVYGDPVITAPGGFEADLPLAGSSLAAQVCRIYDMVFGRMPTLGEIDNWVWRMTNLASYTNYVQPASEGWTSGYMANNAYGAALNRVEAVLAEWQGANFSFFAGSSTDYVNRVYQAAFRRTASSGEVSYWVGQIDAGTWTRAGFATLLCEHSDHRVAAAAAIAALSRALLSSSRSPDDFTGEGNRDLIVAAGGSVSILPGLGNGSFGQGITAPFAGVSSAWQVAGTGDFNGDSRSDILWRNTVTGQISDWLGQGNGSFTDNVGIASNVVSLDWHIIGTGDFNGDGRTDILWRNDNGTISNWLGQTNGGFADNYSLSGNAVSNDWQVKGIGDVNGDGRADIIWRNSSGFVADWLGQANGSYSGNDANLYTQVSTDWQIAGTGDFNGDGRTDIFWRNSSGLVSNWLGQGNGGFLVNDANALTQSISTWTPTSVGDYNGDGLADILWRNTAGDLTAWFGTVNGGYATGTTATVTLGSSYWMAPRPVNSTNYRETDFGYDGLNRLTTTTVVSTSRNAIVSGYWNGASYITRTGNLVTTTQYDANGNVVKVTNADGNVTWSWYDELGHKSAQLDAEGYVTTWSHDAEGNVLVEKRFANLFTGTPSLASVPTVAPSSADRVTTFTYDLAGNRLSETRSGVLAWNPNATTGLLDLAGTDSVISYTYNALGQVMSKSEAGTLIAGYSYDNTGRLTSETRAAFTDANGISVTPTTSYAYDALGDLVTTTQAGASGTFAALARVTTNRYGAGGRLLSTTDAEGNVHSYGYDAAGCESACNVDPVWG